MGTESIATAPKYTRQRGILVNYLRNKVTWPLKAGLSPERAAELIGLPAQNDPEALAWALNSYGINFAHGCVYSLMLKNALNKSGGIPELFELRPMDKEITPEKAYLAIGGRLTPLESTAIVMAHPVPVLQEGEEANRKLLAGWLKRLAETTPQQTALILARAIRCLYFDQPGPSSWFVESQALWQGVLDEMHLTVKERSLIETALSDYWVHGLPDLDNMKIHGTNDQRAGAEFNLGVPIDCSVIRCGRGLNLGYQRGEYMLVRP